MIVVPHLAPPARRWLAHLLRACEDGIRRGDRFDDDWAFEAHSVLRLAIRQRVAGLLHRGMADGRVADPLPEGFRRACERVYYATLRKNLIALDRAREIRLALAQMGVRSAPLKGWAFLEGTSPLHADPGTRPMDDLDLIVGRPDLECAEAVLAELGFQPVTRRSAALRGGHELAFHRRTAGVDLFLELHWAWAGRESLMRGFAVPGERFLDELCAPDESGLLSPTRLGHLLFTAVHAARHALDRWIWLVDLNRLVAREPLDWEALVASARRWRVSGPLYAGLAATRELLRTPIPREALGALAPGPVRRRLLHRSLAASAANERNQRAAWTAKLLLGESWWMVARTAAWAAFPGAAWHEARGRTSRASRRIGHPARVLLASPQER